MHEAKTNPQEFYMNLRRAHGDVVRVRLWPFSEWYLITHPEGIERVLQSNQRNYRKGKFVTRQVGVLTGEGLLTGEGNVWRRQRRIIQPAFQRRELSSLASLTAEALERTAQRWIEFGTKNQTIDLLTETKKLALEILSLSLFSQDLSGRVDAVERAVIVTLNQIGRRMASYPFVIPRFVPTKPNREFKKELKYLDDLVWELIRERRRSSPTQSRDLLALLLEASDDETGERMSNAHVRDNVLSLLMAGYETTATAISTALSFLAYHPEADQKLQEEVTAVLEGRASSFADLPRLTYTRAVIQEAMRLYPPVPAQPREAIGTDEIGGYFIPAGAIIMISQYVTHRHPEFWEAPDVFDPERFTPERSAGRPQFAYFPFGGGGRQCIGKDFATVVSTQVVARLAQTFRLDFSLAPADTSFTLRPQLMFTPRLRSNHG